MVARTRLIVTLYVHCLSCYIMQHVLKFPTVFQYLSYVVFIRVYAVWDLHKICVFSSYIPLSAVVTQLYGTLLLLILLHPFNPLNSELNPICYLLALLRAHHFLHVSRIRVKLLTFRLLMSYIYGAPILDVSRSHTTTQHSR